MSNTELLYEYVDSADDGQRSQALKAVIQRLDQLRNRDSKMTAPVVADFLSEVIGDFVGMPR